MPRKTPVFAPKEVFDQALEYFPMVTFDLVIEVPDKGILLVRRKIAPYAGKWALPGLRMRKFESIDDTLGRIAKAEAGLTVDLPNKRLLPRQYSGQFSTEHDRQDLSSGYVVTALNPDEMTINDEHFTGQQFINSMEELPAATGAMYKFHLESYFETKA